MVAGTGALELPPAGIVVHAAKIGPKELHAAPINADFGVAGGGLGVIWCIIRSIWPTADPKLIELRAESCGIRARGDAGQQRRNLLGLVRIYRKDTFTVAIKLPPLGSYKHERTVTGERESKSSSEYSAGFGYAKGKSSSTTSGDGYEHTGEKWRGGKGDAHGLSQKTEDGKTTRTFTEQHTGNDGGLTLGKPSSAPHTPGSEGRKISSEDGHFNTEVMKELEKQGPIALVIKRNDREFEKELLGPHKSLKQMIVDGLIKGVETIAKAIETFNKLPQVGWKFEFSLSFFAGTIGLEWSPKELPGPIADGRYYPVGRHPPQVRLMGQDTVVHAQIHAEGCTAELYVNGVPVSRIHPDRTAFESVAVEQLLIPGRNRIELLVEPGSRPSRVRTEARHHDLGDAAAVGRLVRFPDGVFAEASRGEVLREVRLERPAGSIGARTVPESFSAEVDLGQAHGRWAWQDAPVLDLEEALVAEARAALDEIAQAWQACSIEGLWALSALNVRETRRAYPALDEASLRADLELLMNHYARARERVAPRASEQHDFRTVAGGRMLECIDLDWAPSLRLLDPDDGSQVPYPVLLARVDGRLCVAR
jgi:hypothetical protein